MTTPRLVVLRESGLYCTPGDFYIDPWRPVHRAVITHAHGDHARTGSKLYLCAASGASVLRARLGDVSLQPLAYGERLLVNDVALSLHPAGHVLGSAQVRLEHRGEVWVVSGDYKLEHDATCAAFESVRCHTFVTESTFGLPVYRPMDVLVQHLVTVALGGGFRSDELYSEVRSCWAYRELTQAQWQWALQFVSSGGSALHPYPEYRKLSIDDDGLYRVHDRGIARRHRMSIGTIVGDASMEVKFLRGARIGTMEESFLSHLKPGDCFLFAGRALQLKRVNEMTAYVKKRAPPGSAAVPRWMGGRMPLSSELALAVRQLVTQAREGNFAEPEMQALQRLFELQARWSSIPAADELLLETAKTRKGHHLFLFPFAGRLVHSGLGALLAWRVARVQPRTFSIAVNDYGLELLTHDAVDWEQHLSDGLLSASDLQHDIEHSVNAAEMGRRRFREIARVSGMVFQGFPGAHKSTRQLQASSGLIYDVFARYDPDNLLLAQARSEALQQELELTRLQATSRRMETQTLLLRRPPHVTPFAFPLLVERIREKLSTEKLADRVSRMIRDLERVAQHA